MSVHAAVHFSPLALGSTCRGYISSLERYIPSFRGVQYIYIWAVPILFDSSHIIF